ncbi:MAG: DnaB-like helicase N-terminal domain-containing protein, partial [Nitrososphaerota archaeon]
MTEHEKALLESILCESLIIDKYKIIPEMFCSSDARNLFDAFVVTIMKGVKLDTIAVSDSLRESKRDDLISVLCSLD